MTTSFLNLPNQGKNQWWRYALGTGLVLFFWLILGSMPFLFAGIRAVTDENPATQIDPNTGLLRGVDPVFGNYVLPNLAFPFFLFGIFFAVRILHKRRLRTLITTESQLSSQRILQGFGLWFGFAAIVTFSEYLLHPEAFSWSSVAPGRYIGFVALALILTPIQTTTEELFFRGYLLQGLGRGIRQPFILAACNGLLFMLPHVFNPEVQSGVVLTLLYYWGIGAFFAWITLKDQRLELALGAHAANNLFVALFVNFKQSALQTPALIQSNRLDPLYNLIAFVMMAAIFHLIVFSGTGEQRRSSQRANQT